MKKKNIAKVRFVSRGDDIKCMHSVLFYSILVLWLLVLLVLMATTGDSYVLSVCICVDFCFSNALLFSCNQNASSSYFQLDLSDRFECDQIAPKTRKCVCVFIVYVSSLVCIRSIFPFGKWMWAKRKINTSDRFADHHFCESFTFTINSIDGLA